MADSPGTNHANVSFPPSPIRPLICTYVFLNIAHPPNRTHKCITISISGTFLLLRTPVRVEKTDSFRRGRRVLNLAWKGWALSFAFSQKRLTAENRPLQEQHSQSLGYNGAHSKLNGIYKYFSRDLNVCFKIIGLWGSLNYV